jgi:hypothetical protein
VSHLPATIHEKGARAPSANVNSQPIHVQRISYVPCSLPEQRRHGRLRKVNLTQRTRLFDLPGSRRRD